MGYDPSATRGDSPWFCNKETQSVLSVNCAEQGLNKLVFLKWAKYFLISSYLVSLLSYTGKVDLVMNVVERPSGGFSAGGGISSGITSGPLRGLIGSHTAACRL
ncbi:unnamed protein product [Vicia faba]|uniref:Uncharacterized protein n=1 Tax=Vicia faba TaxID=3906 RepID=A0AAV0ZAP2_VICFA|nr:unnamed protein product [Vicia faba]